MLVGPADLVKQRSGDWWRTWTTIMNSARSMIKRLRFPLDIMLLCVRWYIAYPLSLRNLEEMMQERGVFVDHSTIHRWIVKLVPVLEEAAVLDGREIPPAYRDLPAK
jgi:putative transposase